MEIIDLNWPILIKLFLSHIITDFVFQPDAWVDDKKTNIWKSVKLYIHGCLAGILAYMFVGSWEILWLPIIVGATHIVIDGYKSKFEENLTIFLVDQVSHIIILILCWIVIIQYNLQDVLELLRLIISSDKFLIYLFAYSLILWPSSKLMKRILSSINVKFGENVDTGHKNVGLWIGMIERILILTFILQNNYQIIGFLIAAKSIFRHRYNGIKNSQVTIEYILLGTMLSFLIAIIVGLLSNTILSAL
jgi:hypothetical protein